MGDSRTKGKPRLLAHIPRQFGWMRMATQNFVSKDGQVRARVEATPEGDARLVIDCGEFSTLDDATNVAHMLLWFLLDAHGYVRDYSEFPTHIFQEVENQAAQGMAEVEVGDDLEDDGDEEA